MDALPTSYNGIHFRSLLEARWAAFFDLMHWPYVYEPCAFSGWIPDFLLRLHKPVFVEVKPVAEWPRQVAEEIDRSECPDECLIAGLGPAATRDDWHEGAVVLGWLREKCEELLARGPVWSWGEAHVGLWRGSESTAKNARALVGFCHGEQSYRDRVTGCYDGGGPPTGLEEINAAVHGAWHHAGRRVQWRRQPGTRGPHGRVLEESRIVRGLATRHADGTLNPGPLWVEDVWREPSGLRTSHRRPVGPPPD